MYENIAKVKHQLAQTKVDKMQLEDTVDNLR